MLQSFLNQLRFKWQLARRGMGYSNAVLEQACRMYLNHNKIIHYRDGYPVCSLTIPALFSKPAANHLVRTLFKVIRNRRTPSLLSLAVTDQCDAQCRHCSFYGALEKPSGRQVLSLVECRRVIGQAQELGVTIISFVGGEPLLRPDLADIVRSVDKDLSATLMFTNGWHLAERARELRGAGLDGVLVSVDSSSAAKHDALRGQKGSFERALAALPVARKAGLSTGLACCLTPETFADGELDRLVELGREAGVHEVLLFAATPSGKFKDRADLVGQPEWIEGMISASKKYNASVRYPGVLAYSYTASWRSIGCSGGVNYVYVSPYGEVCPCDFNHAIFGNIREGHLHAIWDRMSALEDFRAVKWGGCKLRDPNWRGKRTVSGEFRRYDWDAADEGGQASPR